MDDLLRADRYGSGGWSFTIAHFQPTADQQIIDQEAVIKALGLKLAPAINNFPYYQATTPNPWFEQLARFSLGVPRQLQALPKQIKRSLCVHFHDPQTMIIADEAPLVALLKENKRFKSYTPDCSRQSGRRVFNEPTRR